MCHEIRSAVVKGRKPHRCWGCCEIIPAGVPHLASTCVGDGAVYTVHMCDPCEAFWTSEPFRKRMRDEGWHDDEIEEGQIGILRRGGEL